MGIIRLVGKQLHKFDSFGEKIQINLKGKDTVTTKLGGLCGLSIYIFLFVFCVYRFIHMIQLEDPDVYEVLQGIDLLDPDAAFVGFGDHNFTAGMGAFIKK